jgi:hypothetical protein
LLFSDIICPAEHARRRSLALGWRYNTAVAVSKRQNDSSGKPRHSIYATETEGHLLIAFLILVLTLVRYWQEIHWSWR